MNGTVLDHRLVRDYLRELAAATRGLPGDRARELRDQIAAHLDDALHPDADDDEVAATLSRLGAPADIAAEAGAPVPAASARLAPGLVRALLAAVRPRTWILAGLAVILVAVGAAYADHYLSAGPLQYSSGGDWWYQQDVRHQHIASTTTATQNTAPIRSGQRQGYVISMFNPTSVTDDRGRCLRTARVEQPRLGDRAAGRLVVLHRHRQRRDWPERCRRPELHPARCDPAVPDAARPRALDLRSLPWPGGS
jgi:hypothetical protein